MSVLPRAFYERNTLRVARDLLGKCLVHRTAEGLVRGRIVETEAYAGIFDPASHTYKKQVSPRTEMWYGPGGFAYVYSIYGCYVCLGIITEPVGVPGAVLIRALEPLEGRDLMLRQRGQGDEEAERVCAGPSKLCLALGITRTCNHLDLCGDRLYLEMGTEPVAFEHIQFTPRINIDYAGAGAFSAWRYAVRESPALSRKTYEPLRTWRVQGYPSTHQVAPLNMFSYLAQQEEEVVPMSDEMTQQIRVLPKVELHLHLEGCMTVATVRQLAQRHRIPLPVHLHEEKQKTHQFSTYDEFVHSYYSLCRLLIHEQDFALLAADLADYLQQNAITYCEVAWTPFLYLNRGLQFEAVLAVLNETLEARGVRERVRFLIDIQRDHGLEAGEWIFHQVFAARDLHIAGVGLTGQEEGFPPAEYQRLFLLARQKGLGCTAHAGEYGTAEDVWQCLQQLGVSRIGHGLRAVHDPLLLCYLAEHQIHLEVCQTSNVRLGRVPSYAAHPLRAFWQQRIPLSINSDDPRLFSSDLTQEYLKAMQHGGLTLADLQQTVLGSLAAAFLPPAEKQPVQEHILQTWPQSESALPVAQRDNGGRSVWKG